MDNDLRLNHQSVAARHAWISLRHGTITIEALSSANPVTVNDRPVDISVLERNDIVRIGQIEVRLLPVSGVAPQQKSVSEAWRSIPPTFSDFMGAELRKMPFVALSLTVHVMVVLLLWLLIPVEPNKVADPEVEFTASAGTFDLPEQQIPEVPLNQPTDPLVEDPFHVQRMEDLRDVATGPGQVVPGETGVPDRISLELGREAMFTKIAGHDGSGSAFGRGGRLVGIGGGEFRETVRQLRATGLDIVFVFDSTSSMNSVIDSAKQTIERMMQVLQVLVPDARIGVVTYRDHGRNEEYVVRTLPLSTDPLRAVNFVHSVSAAGGGDIEEAVFEALEEAFGQKWNKESRRVVVLVGDAAPHAATRQRLREEVLRFASDGRSFVHTIVTPAGGGRIARQAREAFARIAEDGKGIMQEFTGSGIVLQNVLDVAFGGNFRRDVDEVYMFVDERQGSATSYARDLVHRCDKALIVAALEKVPVDDDVIRALTLSRNKKVAELMVDLMGDRKRPPHARQAASYALQRILGLDQPPLDPSNDKVLAPRQASTLKRLAHERL